MGPFPSERNRLADATNDFPRKRFSQETDFVRISDLKIYFDPLAVANDRTFRVWITNVSSWAVDQFKA